MRKFVTCREYSNSKESLSYWRTYTEMEVDAVIGDAKVAIEMKSVEEMLPRHLKSLTAFGERASASSFRTRSSCKT